MSNLIFLTIFSFTPISIAIDHLFNDVYPSVLQTIAIYCFATEKNFLGVLLISFALGFKLGPILLIPAVFLVTSKSQGIFIGTLHLLMIVTLQILFSLPFVLHYPTEYFTSAYNIGRRFGNNAILNYRMLPLEVLWSDYFNIFLTVGHLTCLLIFLFKRWVDIRTIFDEISLWPLRLFPKFKKQNTKFVIDLFFLCNFVGITFMKGLHMQFVLWYWFSLPYVIYTGPGRRYKLTFYGYLLIISLLSYVYTAGNNYFTTSIVQPLHFWLLLENIFSSESFKPSYKKL